MTAGCRTVAAALLLVASASSFSASSVPLRCHTSNRPVARAVMQEPPGQTDEQPELTKVLLTPHCNSLAGALSHCNTGTLHCKSTLLPACAHRVRRTPSFSRLPFTLQGRKQGVLRWLLLVATGGESRRRHRTGNQIGGPDRLRDGCACGRLYGQQWLIVRPCDTLERATNLVLHICGCPDWGLVERCPRHGAGTRRTDRRPNAPPSPGGPSPASPPSSRNV